MSLFIIGTMATLIRKRKRQNQHGGNRKQQSPLLSILLILVLAVCSIFYSRIPSTRTESVSKLNYSLNQLSVNHIGAHKNLLRTNSTKFNQGTPTTLLSLLLILQAGDINPNPGPRPPKFPCQVCNKAAKWGQKCLMCDLCELWYHADCLGMSDSLYLEHENHPSICWTCAECGMPQYWNMSSSLFHSTRSRSTLSSAESMESPSSMLSPQPSRTPAPKTPSTHQPPATPRCRPAPAATSTPKKPGPGHPDQQGNLTFVVANCNGMTGKKPVVEQMLESLNPDVFVAVESKVDSSILDAEILPAPYRPITTRKDRAKGGGGVLIATKEGIIAEPLTEEESAVHPTCELCWSKIHLKNKESMIVGAYYRPPDSNKMDLHHLNTSITNVLNKFNRSKIVLAGDFNLSGIHWPTLSHTPGKPKKEECEDLLRITAENNLIQMNEHPTRKNNILELFLTSTPELVTSCTTGPGISDHDHIVIAKMELTTKQNRKEPRTIQLFKKANWDGLRNSIINATSRFLSNCPDTKPIEDNWKFFKETLLTGLKQFVPNKTVSGRYNLPWITTKVKRLIRRKQRAYNRAKRSHKDVDWAKFRHLRKEAQKLMKQAHWDYVNSILDADTNNSKGLWRYLKGLRKDSTGVSPLTHEGRMASTPREKAEALNKQFSSVFTKEDPSSCPTLPESPYQEMPPILVMENGVRTFLERLNPKKATGADSIPAIVLKFCAAEVAPMLTSIINQSLSQHKVPEDWKRAIVTPVFKKGSRAKPENYRPISLTSICCKTAEHIIVSNTMAHLDKNNILSDDQHGFRRNRSCESQLLRTTQDLGEILNTRSQADVAVLDFAKAFDKVPHHRLIIKLRHLNINKDVIGWIEDFLKNRTQQVAVDGALSDEAPVLSGVPQGTVVSPMLFLIFINDIASNITSSIRLFADDCLLFREIKCQADHETLQRDLNHLVTWSQTWGMKFNIKKCNVMSVTNKRRPSTFTYRMEDTPLERVTETLYLGVTISSNLSWKSQVNRISSSAERILGFLWRNMHKCPKELRERAFNAIVRSRLSYAASVWDPHQATLSKRLEGVQRRGARFVNNTRHKRSLGQKNASPTSMLKDLSWEPLETNRKQQRLITFHKIIQNQVAIPQSYLPPRKTGRTSSTNRFIIPHSNVNAHRDSFIPKTTRDWNALPDNIVNIEDALQFKLHLKQHLSTTTTIH